MSAHYRHTQTGWVILGVAAALIALGWATLPPGVPAAPMLLIAVLVALLFGTLTVEVDHEAVRLRFGVGLVRKRLPLRDVQAWREVRNPWYCGWGIHAAPGGVLWNVSGLDAVELTLDGGRHFRIGSDEPADLAAAIARTKGTLAQTSASATALSPPASEGFAWARWLPAIVVGVTLVGIAGLFWTQRRPPGVNVGPEGLRVDTLFYGATFAADDITAVSLERSLPRVLARTNGFAGAGTLRGWFRLERLGEGRLYVEEGRAPYVLVRLREGFAIVSFREPERTRALFDEMARQWPDRVGMAPS
jgi:hypothetical protein